MRLIFRNLLKFTWPKTFFFSWNEKVCLNSTGLTQKLQTLERAASNGVVWGEDHKVRTDGVQQERRGGVGVHWESKDTNATYKKCACPQLNIKIKYVPSILTHIKLVVFHSNVIRQTGAIAKPLRGKHSNVVQGFKLPCKHNSTHVTHLFGKKVRNGSQVDVWNYDFWFWKRMMSLFSSAAVIFHQTDSKSILVNTLAPGKSVLSPM